MYCSQEDMVNAFGEQEIRNLSDRARPPAGVINASVVAQAISDAGSEINMYLEGRGLLPLKTVPETLRRICCDVARYYLYQNPADEHPVASRYRTRVRQLEGVASGKLSLGLDEAGEVQVPDETIEFTAGTNMFRPRGPGGGIW